MQIRGIERRLLETERVYALGVITAGLARELRTPVAATKARISRVREGLKLALSNLTHTTAANAGSLSARLYEADEDLAEALVGLDRTLDVVRGIELPTRQGDAEATDLSEVLRLTLRLMQSGIRSSASLEVDVRPVPEVAGSSAQLAQVVMNLLVNALKSMGGPSSQRKMLCIRLVPDGDFVRLEVGDSSRGSSRRGSTSCSIRSPVAVATAPRDWGSRFRRPSSKRWGAQWRQRTAAPEARSFACACRR